MQQPSVKSRIWFMLQSESTHICRDRFLSRTLATQYFYRGKYHSRIRFRNGFSGQESCATRHRQKTSLQGHNFYGRYSDYINFLKVQITFWHGRSEIRVKIEKILASTDSPEIWRARLKINIRSKRIQRPNLLVVIRTRRINLRRNNVMSTSMPRQKWWTHAYNSRQSRVSRRRNDNLKQNTSFPGRLLLNFSAETVIIRILRV